MCDIGKVKQVTLEAAPQKVQDVFRRVGVMIPAEKVFRPLVKVRVRRNEDRV